MGSRIYTAEERMACLAALASNGNNFARTARQCGVPRPTLMRWAREHAEQVAAGLSKPVDTPYTPQKSPIVLAAEGLPVAESLLADKFDAFAHKAVGVADRKVDDLSAKDAVIAAGVAVDKFRLLRGKSTANVDHRPDLSQLSADELDTLERLAAITRRNRVGAVPSLP